MKQVISDNYVTGDNIYLRELQNFFFEVLGMMSVTHYGAIGDGRTDCYGPLQVAIDDAKRRNLDHIYVPMGRYIYTGELINREGITFIGNPHAVIVNIRTCERIPVKQFGWCDCDEGMVSEFVKGNYTSLVIDGEYINLDDVSVGEVVDMTPIQGENVAYYVSRVVPGESFDVIGDFTLVSVDPYSKEVRFKYSATIEDYGDRIKWSCKDNESLFICSFKNTDQYLPGIFRNYNYVVKTGDTMTGSLAIGPTSTASGDLSFAQGDGNTASGKHSHAQGWNNTASGQYSFAGGTLATASGFDSIAFGNYVVEPNEYIGNTRGNQATGNTAIALGSNTIASGKESVTIGHKTTASGNDAMAEGDGTIAQGYVQHAQGKYNIAEGSPNVFYPSDLAVIVGNGRADDQRSNAHTLDFGGNGWFAGDVYVGSTSGTNRDSGSRRLATEEYVDNLIAQIQSLNYFQQSIAPTTWGTQVALNKEYTETDNYGTWRIYADNSAGSGWGVQNAFDGNDSTGWKSDDTSQGNSVNIGMDFPVLIKPTEFRVLPGSSLSSSNLWTATLQGKNTDNTWDTLISFELPQTQHPSPLKPQVAVDKWYKGFRAVLTRPNGTSSTQKVIESLEITKGFWKEMT